MYAKAPFTVIKFEDLSNRLDLMLPISDETVASFCCWSCKTRPIILSVSAPHGGFVPEQSIRLRINIDNRCGFDVSRTIISLRKVFAFISQTPTVCVWTDVKTLTQNVLQGAKSGKETKVFGVLDVPAFTLPTNDEISKVVKVSYFIQVSLDVVGFIRRPTVKLPIVIGSKPLRLEKGICSVNFI